MKHKLKTLVMSLSLVLGVAVYSAAPVGAINVFKACPDGSTSEVCKAKDESVQGPTRTVISTLLFAIGIISVVMIIVGGLKYTTSNGDASRIKSAKDTILYAVIGLVVSLLAYTIVNFVVTQFS